MSVAFRRESDEEHLEPRFELPIPPGPNLVTARGLALIAERAESLGRAVAEETDAEQQKVLQRELRYWRARQATAQLTPPTAGEEAGFGSRVLFRLNGQKRQVDIVGDDEADPATGHLGFSAPLARALIGAGEGDLLPFGGKADAIEILSVAPIPA